MCSSDLERRRAIAVRSDSTPKRSTLAGVARRFVAVKCLEEAIALSPKAAASLSVHAELAAQLGDRIGTVPAGTLLGIGAGHLPHSGTGPGRAMNFRAYMAEARPRAS